eukprot:188380-Heterocapsa_arctica.AAC.1
MDMDGASPRVRLRKSAAERRAQRLRAEARVAQRLLRAFVAVDSHRGGCLSRLGADFLQVLRGGRADGAARANDAPVHQHDGQPPDGSLPPPEAGAPGPMSHLRERPVPAPLAPHAPPDPPRDLVSFVLPDMIFNLIDPQIAWLDKAVADNLRQLQELQDHERQHVVALRLRGIQVTPPAPLQRLHSDMGGGDLSDALVALRALRLAIPPDGLPMDGLIDEISRIMMPFDPHAYNKLKLK